MFGYLDPGSGSLIVQAVLGGLAGLAVLFRTMGRRFSKRRSPEEPAATVQDPSRPDPTP
ncbi:MAG: hypothetical protein ACRDVM_03835 [Acidimicrobiia bacterium]